MNAKDIQQILVLNGIKKNSQSPGDYNKAIHIFQKILNKHYRKNEFEYRRIVSIIDNWIFNAGEYKPKKCKEGNNDKQKK